MEKKELTSVPSASKDLVDFNIRQLKALFPNVFSEGKIDFDALKNELGDNCNTGGSGERYQFTWAGKEQAKRIATTPSLGTLRPAPDESLNWESTENLYIEGDNLEVLKLLQKSYFNQIKMIYIDPPYNTGKDFVYKDNFRDNLANYQRLTGQRDGEGNPLTTNSESDGRYHSNWLNMMYPRLKLARNLLTDDGVIFISIDDNEVHNLRKICDEIFGEENFIGVFIWKSKSGGANDSGLLAVDHEYILCISKNINSVVLNEDPEGVSSTIYNHQDELGRYSLERLDKQNLQYSASLDYEITGPDGTVYKLNHRNPDQPNAIWRWSQDRVSREIDSLVFKDGNVYTKNYEKKGVKPRSLLVEERFGRTRTGSSELRNMIPEGGFDNPKTTKLIRYFVNIGSSEESIVLDFFSGSSTTANTIMQLNSEDGANRKFIMVQIPEQTPEKSSARRIGFKTVAEIGKERIRRAATKIRNEHPETDIDLGFKVFKLDTSNLKKWQPDSGNLEKDLLDAIDNILPDRSNQDLLYEVLIKYGLPLTYPVEEIKIANHTIFNVANGSLIACFDEGIDLETVQAIADLSTEEWPVLRVVFRDTSFVDDIVKTNAIQRLLQAGIEDVLSI